MPGHRRSIRLKEYDYTQFGAYYITLCTHGKQCVFGNVMNGQMILNDIGKMADEWWKKLPDKFNSISIDEYCVMPNHFHGIIQIVGADTQMFRADTWVRPYGTVVDPAPVGAHPRVRPNDQHPRVCPSISTIVQWFKTMTTNEYIRNVKNNRWPPFDKHIWQRNYYERIIRDDGELNHLREYIIHNAIQWENDDYYS